MSGASAIFLVALFVVIALQTFHRLVGSVAAVVWCLAVAVWGFTRIQDGAEMTFFGVRSDPKLFGAVIAAFVAYNGWLVARELKARRLRKQRPT